MGTATRLSLQQEDALAASDAAGREWMPIRAALLPAGIRTSAHLSICDIPGGLYRRNGAAADEIAVQLAGLVGGQWEDLDEYETLDAIAVAYSSWRSSQDGLVAARLRLRGRRPAYRVAA